MKLNWFSTSSQLEYTLEILPLLSQQIEVIVWREATQILDPTLENYASIRDYQPEKMPWKEINKSNLNLYLLGEETDQSIYKISSQSPGLIIYLGGQWEIESTIGILTHNLSDYQRLQESKRFLTAYTLLPQKEDLDTYIQDLINFSQKVINFRSLATHNLMVQRVTDKIGTWNNLIVFEEEIENIAQAIDFICN